MSVPRPKRRGEKLGLGTRARIRLSAEPSCSPSVKFFEKSITPPIWKRNEEIAGDGDFAVVC
ncbi:MAG: hypothetical protein A3J48_04015 [Candidatus Doudnabacteria bacterium RIFCSPHIGHO2_02_FULL_46_11]|uniref:Uncharacterized protein n=1 Tax=Candidatus Doudnabacteria bacterium RIFCSPHIGHO2_02_FULL_46_11 TaxID=1817832 RepID=A0A1F5P8F0_9BACT|nr:MAG: hypothetical protein A3J48_04015 [Candidatus Doudnabacteria bacterium RIFCSPHIGHO2_02_FULL_46_11]